MFVISLVLLDIVCEGLKTYIMIKLQNLVGHSGTTDGSDGQSSGSVAEKVSFTSTLIAVIMSVYSDS